MTAPDGRPTPKVLWEDPYLTGLDTTVNTVAAPEVTVDARISCAFAGGQESDADSMVGLPLLEARKEGR